VSPASPALSGLLAGNCLIAPAASLWQPVPEAHAFSCLRGPDCGTSDLFKAGHCEKMHASVLLRQSMQGGTVRRLSEQRVVSALAGWARRFDLVNDPGTDDVVSWTPDGRRCVPRPPLPPVKGGRAACARAGMRAPGRATHLDRERPADHPLCAARGSFVVWQHEKFEREVLPLWFPKMTSLRRFNRELCRYVRARHQLPPFVCALRMCWLTHAC